MAGTEPVRDRPVVAMMVANTVKSDGRVHKSASAVASFGYDVHLLGVSPDGELHVGSVGRATLRLVPVSWVLRHAPPRVPSLERVRRRAATWLGIDDETEYETKRRRIKLEQREIESARGRTRPPGDRQLRRTFRRGQLSLQSRLVEMKHSLEPASPDDDGAGWRTKLPEMHDYEFAFGDQLMRTRPDVIHAHDVHLLGVAVRTAERMRARGADPKVIYDSHEFVPGVASNHPWKTAMLAEMEREYIDRVDRIITVSPLLAEWLERDHRPTHPVSVVMNTPVAAWHNETDEVPSLRHIAGLPPGVPLVVYSGGYSPFRGVHTLVDAMVHLPDCHLVMVAPDGHRYVGQLCSRGEEKGVGDRIHVAPFVPPHQVSRYLAEADVGVHPMLHAPNHEVALPNKYFEYLHAGLPMVVSDVELMSRQARLDGVGEVFVAEDDVGLAEAISRVLADPHRYTSNITPALLHEYSWERQGEYLRAVYADIGLAVAPSEGPIETSVTVEGITYPEAIKQEEVEPTVLIGPDQLEGQVPQLAGALARHSKITTHTAGFIEDQPDGARALDVPMPRRRWHDEPWQRVHLDRITNRYSHIVLTGATSLMGPIYGGLLGDEIAMLNTREIEVALLLDRDSLRDPQLHRELEPDSPFRLAPDGVVVAAEARSRHTRSVARASNAVVFVTTVDLLDEVRDAAWLPMVVDMTDTAVSTLDAVRSPPVVVHAPIDPFYAGSAHVDRIGARLDDEGLIDYRSAHGTDAHERHELLGAADIVLDDFASGHHGLVALEALALGRIVVANQSHRVRSRLPEEAPLVSSSLDQLESTLRSIVDDSTDALATASLGPSYVHRYHDGRLTAAQLERWVRYGGVMSIDDLARLAATA